MDKVLPALGILIVVTTVFLLLARGWRARRRSQAELGEPAAPPAELGAVALRDDLLYVATTRAGSPLDRIAVAGLGYRARATVTVAASGVVLELAGRAPVFVPAASIEGAGRATWTIDKAVGTDGLVVLTWSLNGTAVDTSLRSADPAALLAAITALAPTPPAPTTPTTPRSVS